MRVGIAGDESMLGMVHSRRRERGRSIVEGHGLGVDGDREGGGRCDSRDLTWRKRGGPRIGDVKRSE